MKARIGEFEFQADGDDGHISKTFRIFMEYVEAATEREILRIQTADAKSIRVLSKGRSPTRDIEKLIEALKLTMDGFLPEAVAVEINHPVERQP